MGRPIKPKKCPSCGTGDPIAFAKNKARRDGLQTYCRDCTKPNNFRQLIKSSDFESQSIEAYLKLRED